VPKIAQSVETLTVRRGVRQLGVAISRSLPRLPDQTSDGLFADAEDALDQTGIDRDPLKCVFPCDLLD
jgi:hypothetical protein